MQGRILLIGRGFYKNTGRIAKIIVMACFFVQLTLSIIILTENSSTPSVIMTISRIIAALSSIILTIFVTFKIIKSGLENIIIKGVAILAICFRILTDLILRYYSKNPTQECFVSYKVTDILTYLDLISLVTILINTYEVLKY